MIPDCILIGVWYRLVYISSENLKYVRYVTSEEAKVFNPPPTFLTNSWIRLRSPFLPKKLKAYFTVITHIKIEKTSSLKGETNVRRCTMSALNHSHMQINKEKKHKVYLYRKKTLFQVTMHKTCLLFILQTTGSAYSLWMALNSNKTSVSHFSIPLEASTARFSF